MAHYTSTTNPKVKDLIKLKKRPGDVILIEGLHLIEMAVNANLVIELFTTTTLPFSVPISTISGHIAEKLSGKVTTDGHFALIHRPNLMLDLTKPLLYLDDISDPGNMGTLMRTALAFSFGGIIASANSVSFYNEKVLAAAQGAHFSLPLISATAAKLIELKTNGYKILVSDVQAGVNVSNFKNKKCVIVLGNEARGVSKEVAALASAMINIKISNIESLNVAIAGALLMYELTK